jgi:hypothetical protein
MHHNRSRRVVRDAFTRARVWRGRKPRPCTDTWARDRSIKYSLYSLDRTAYRSFSNNTTRSRHSRPLDHAIPAINTPVELIICKWIRLSQYVACTYHGLRRQIQRTQHWSKAPQHWFTAREFLFERSHKSGRIEHGREFVQKSSSWPRFLEYDS